jgi:hypothetical protein
VLTTDNVLSVENMVLSAHTMVLYADNMVSSADNTMLPAGNMVLSAGNMVLSADDTLCYLFGALSSLFRISAYFRSIALFGSFADRIIFIWIRIPKIFFSDSDTDSDTDPVDVYFDTNHSKVSF